MPKQLMSKQQWEVRLRMLAAGTYKFGRGERPPKNSLMAKKVEKVERCPKHLNSSTFNPFGQRIACVCSYHESVSSAVSIYYSAIIIAIK